MTMALVTNGEVTQIGLPAELRSQSLPALKAAGWHKVVGTPKPTKAPKAGYQWEYGAEWSVDDDAVLGTWTQVKRPQPYPSWTWDNGWKPPVPYPDEGEWQWDEDTQKWVEVNW